MGILNDKLPKPFRGVLSGHPVSKADALAECKEADELAVGGALAFGQPPDTYSRMMCASGVTTIEAALPHAREFLPSITKEQFVEQWRQEFGVSKGRYEASMKVVPCACGKRHGYGDGGPRPCQGWKVVPKEEQDLKEEGR